MQEAENEIEQSHTDILTGKKVQRESQIYGERNRKNTYKHTKRQKKCREQLRYMEKEIEKSHTNIQKKCRKQVRYMEREIEKSHTDTHMK